jgi:hypothetical protein
VKKSAVDDLKNCKRGNELFWNKKLSLPNCNVQIKLKKEKYEKISSGTLVI